MSDSAGNHVNATQAQGPPPMYPPQQPPGYPPQYPPQPGYGAPMPPPGPPPMAPPPPLDVGSTLSDAFNLYKNNFGAFFAFWAIPAILAIALELFEIAILGSQAAVLAGGEQPDMEDLGALMGLLALSMAFSVIVIIISILFTGGIIGMTKKAMETGTTDAGTGFETIKKYFGAIIVTSIVVGILIAVGFMLCCIPGILFCYWWMFAVTIVVVEGVGLTEAMSRSKQFAETRHTFGFAVILIIVVIAISIIAGMIAGAISAGVVATMGFWPGQIVSNVIGQLFQWIIAPFATIAIAVHYIKGRGPPVVGPPPYPPTEYPPPQYTPQPYGPPPQNMP